MPRLTNRRRQNQQRAYRRERRALERQQVQQRRQQREEQEEIERNHDHHERNHQRQSLLPPSLIVDNRTVWDEYARKFERFQEGIKYKACNSCNQAFYDLEFFANDEMCKRCKRFQDNGTVNIFSAENEMDPGELPLELQNLTYIEEQLIAQVHPVMSVYRLKYGQMSYKGHVINFHQDVFQFATELPHSIDTISRFVLIRKEGGAGYTDFYVNRERVRKALFWLKGHNPLYASIEISTQNLYELPENEDIFNRILESQRSANQRSNNSVQNEAPAEIIESATLNDESEDDLVIDTGAPNLQVRNNHQIVNQILNIQGKK